MPDSRRPTRQRPVRLGIVGFGKIAHDKHLPALATQRFFALRGIADPVAADPMVTAPSLTVLLEAEDRVEAVALCTPPRVRHALAREAINAGIHVMLEKPPTATTAELNELRVLAVARGCTLFAAWHSQFAAGVSPARAWLGGRSIRAIRIRWLENVRQWHPEQRWILEANGFGVFDAGINAFSILTSILPQTLQVIEAQLQVPRGSSAPISAQVRLQSVDGCGIAAEFSFLHTGTPIWEIEVDVEGHQLRLIEGGQRLVIDGAERILPGAREYSAVYARFAQLIAAGGSDVNGDPLVLTEEALTRGALSTVAAVEL